jgi:hypothetical protein
VQTGGRWQPLSGAQTWSDAGYETVNRTAAGFVAASA